MLLVEDNESDAMLFRRALKQAKIKIPLQWVKDGVEALEYLQAKGLFSDRTKFPFPDLIVLDLKMPRLSGLELLAWIHDHHEYDSLSTIVLSSSQLESDMKQARALGAQMYLIKPFDFAALVKMVSELHKHWCVRTPSASD